MQEVNGQYSLNGRVLCRIVEDEAVLLDLDFGHGDQLDWRWLDEAARREGVRTSLTYALRLRGSFSTPRCLQRPRL